MEAKLTILRSGKVIWETPFTEVISVGGFDANEGLYDIEQAINSVTNLRAHIETRIGEGEGDGGFADK